VVLADDHASFREIPRASKSRFTLANHNSIWFNQDE
jgi:hypothetical protein